MKKSVRVGMVAAAAFATVATSVGTASAAPAGNPNATKVANPAQACAAIPGTLAQLDIEPAGFSFSSCVRTVSGRVPDLPPPFGNPYEQCAVLEEGVMTPGGLMRVTYPYVFHAEPGDPFPNLRANNREQCARALWTFHTIESYLEFPE